MALASRKHLAKPSKAAALVLLLAVVAGCGGSDDKVSTTEHEVPSVGTDGRPKGVDDPRADAILRDYRNYWDVLIELSHSRPASDGIEAVATPPESDRATKALADLRKNKLHLEGSFKHDARLAAVTAKSATVSDCLTADAFPAKAGESRPTTTPHPQLVTVRMALSASVWKVADIKPDTSSSCMAYTAKKDAK